MSLTQGIETRLYIASSAPLDVYGAECKQCGVCIIGDDFFETLNFTPSPLMRIRRKLNNLRW